MAEATRTLGSPGLGAIDLRRMKRALSHWVLAPLRSIGRPKIFCIGRNKTGTTSLARALSEFGYPVASWRHAAVSLHGAYESGDWARIARFCRHGQVLHDFPFSWPETFKHMAEAFPDARFILTTREPEAWYASVVRFYTKRAPEGLPESALRSFGTTSANPYDKPVLLDNFARYNASVFTYFQGQPSRLLTLDVSEAESYASLCGFLERSPLRDGFPRVNVGQG